MKPKEKSLLLSVDERKPTRARIVESTVLFVVVFIPWIILDLFSEVKVVGSIAWIAAVIGIPLLNFFLSRYRFELYEEGVKPKRRFGKEYFYRWDSFRSYTANRGRKLFMLKLKSIGSIELASTKKFDDIERILSEHITSSVVKQEGMG